MIHALESAAIVDAMAADLRSRIEALPVAPHLTIVESCGGQIDPAQAAEIGVYRRSKLRFAKAIGVIATPLHAKPADILEEIEWANADRLVHGVILEMPVAGFSKDEGAALAASINPKKAVDNQGWEPAWGIDATTESTIGLLDSKGFNGKGKTVLVVGSSGRIGEQVVKEYSHADRGVNDLLVVGRRSDMHKLPDLAKKADVIISTTGQPGIITPELIHPGVAIASIGALDVHPDVRSLTGIDFWLTPLEGGVGPGTTCRLLRRVVTLAEGGQPHHPFRQVLASAQR